MPELPEVETVCRGLQASVAGKRIARVETRRKGLRIPFPPDLQATCRGAKIKNISRRAKYVLMHLDNAKTIILHLGMSGRLVIDDGRKAARQKHDHAILHLADGSRVVFNDARRFGILETAETAGIALHRFFMHLGPEPLEKEFNAKELLRRLAGRKTPVKIAIMDQRTVVGVGNIYAAEALFLAGINPKLPAGSLKPAEAALLVAAIRKVLRRAIRAGGSTLRDYVQADGEFGYFQHSFAVYDRAGEKCIKCTSKNGIIEKVTQGGRSTFYCPVCQK